MRRITVNSNLRTYLKGFLKRRIRPKARKDSRDSAPRKHELSPLTTPALTMAPRLRAFTVSLPPPAAQAAGPHANRHKFRAFSSLRVPHRPGRPALLDEKVQRRFGCAPNLFFLAKRSNPEPIIDCRHGSHRRLLPPRDDDTAQEPSGLLAGGARVYTLHTFPPRTLELIRF